MKTNCTAVRSAQVPLIYL